ncbi:MAG: hypothetical protein M3O02_11325 [Acidobacteriota bacterium]|nr:hypothetical protein [Acidobacteriota bacterium]
MRTEGHDMGRDAADSSTPGNQFDAENPGYETTDVNVGGVVVFLGGLAGFLAMFFVVCYFLGILINRAWDKQDGAPTKWKIAAGEVPTGKLKNLATNPELQQMDLQRVTANFPQPRLDIDDSNQSTADLHAREDLLLEHYSTVDGHPDQVRIPIERAMQLIAQRGLPVAAAPRGAGPLMAGDAAPQVNQPLTTGFARTGYELTVMEAREQRLNYGAAEAAMPTAEGHK